MVLADQPHPLLAKLADNGISTAATPQKFDADLIPDLGPEPDYGDDPLAAWLDPVTIVDAYNRWANKGFVNAGNKTESIKVRCPNPTHEDNHPSAWLNTNKGDGGIGICRACGDLGFDKYLIYAWNAGLTSPGSQIGAEFPQVRQGMAQELGAKIRISSGIIFVESDEESDSSSPTGDEDGPGRPSLEPDGDGVGGSDDMDSAADLPPDHSTAPMHPLLGKLAADAEPDPDLDPPSEPESSPGPKPRLTLVPDDDSGDTKIHLGATMGVVPPSIDWESMLKPGTFLRSWMDALAVNTDIPHEYILFNGLVAIGAVVKRNLYMLESRRVYSNMMTLLLGDTSTGKSRSFDPLMEVLDTVDPYSDPDASSEPTGTRHVGVFGSGESLIAGCRKEILDPSATGAPPQVVGLNVLAKMEEFSLAMGLARRPGNSFKEHVMSLYDTGATSHTSLSSGNLAVDDAFLQVISSTQPDAVSAFLGRFDVYGGFLNRWVPISGTNRLGYQLAVMDSHVDLSGPAEMLTEIKGWAEVGRSMRFSGDALDAWVEFFDKASVLIRNVDSPLSARWDLTLKKIILLLTADQMLDQPTVEIVGLIRDYIFPYMCGMYAAFGNKIVTTEDDEVFELVERCVDRFHTKHDNWPTMRDINKSSAGKRFGQMKVGRMVVEMVKIGFLDKIPSGRTARYAISDTRYATPEA